MRRFRSRFVPKRFRDKADAIVKRNDLEGKRAGLRHALATTLYQGGKDIWKTYRRSTTNGPAKC